MAWGIKRIDAIDIRKRTQWYAYIRLLYLLALAAPGIVSLYVFEGFSEEVKLNISLTVIAVGSNLVFYGLTRASKKAQHQRALASFFIGIDILLVSFFFLTHGGIESRSPILYVVPILMAGALFGRRGIYLSALGSISLYSLFISLDYLNIIQSTGAIDPTLRSNFPYVINTISFFSAILFVIAIGIDFITNLLFEKQKQVSETVEALEAAQEIAKLGSWEWDVEKDEITWSKELFRIHGLAPTSTKLSYQSYLSMLHPADAASHQKIIVNAMRRKINFSVDHQLELPNGNIRYIHGQGRPIKNESGTVIKMAGTAQDVTDLYHLDIAKREFVSLASHQLRTPASGVKAFLSLLLDGYGGDLTRKQRQFLKQAYEANDKQLGIIDNLLSLASIESGKLTVTLERSELQTILKQCLPTHLPQIRQRKQRLQYKKPSTPLYVLADSNVLHMAIDNLISNASKYSPEKGQIHIEVRANKSSAFIDVTDNGIGIAKKNLQSLFQKFNRLSDPASKTVGGSGLGLYMAKYIVELHGGKISVHSTHGLGTTFTIKLPLSK